MKKILSAIVFLYFNTAIFSQLNYSPEPVRILKSPNGGILSLAFHPNGTILASGMEDKTCDLWSFPEGKVLNSLTGFTFGVQALLFNPDGTFLCASGDRTIKIYKTPAEYINTYQSSATQVWSMAFNPKYNGLVAGSYDKSIKMIDFATGKAQGLFTGHVKNALAVAFSPDGKLMASGSLDQTIKIWDVETRKVLQTGTGHGGNIFSVLFTADSKKVISASADNSIRIWDVATGKTEINLLEHAKAVVGLAISPDGAYLLSASYDADVKLWDIARGEVVTTFSGHKLPVTTVAFHPQGKFFASGSQDKTIMIWEINPDVFAYRYFQNEIDQETSQSPFFAPKGKDEPKADYKARQDKAEAFRQELVKKYYERYLKEIKGKK